MGRVIQLLLLLVVFSCNNQRSQTVLPAYTDDILQSVIADTTGYYNNEILQQQLKIINNALQQPIPILLCVDTLNSSQLVAQSIAVNDSVFVNGCKNTVTKQPYRCEIFGVYPARESDMAAIKAPYLLNTCFRIELYNYALNNTIVAIVDNSQQKVLAIQNNNQTQPDIPAYLKKIAIKIAIESPQMQQAYGIKPTEKDALMASTKTALNRSHCERSRHLCVAPTFVKADKALWAIVDLSDFKLVGLRWTNTGTTGPAAPITERKLQDDKISACFCEKETALQKDDWKMNYMLTSSDGLRVSAVSYKNQPILQSAKLVDWHVSYSGTDGFGYSDAVGCPYFSQAAVIAIDPPMVAALKDETNKVVGFVLEQTFKSEGWPAPCNYNYRQRYEFYKDGRFRIAAASIGRGCGSDGTYRPVFRIAFANPQNNFGEWNGNSWQYWQKEKWQLQQANTAYTIQGYQYIINNKNNNGFFIMPGNGQFKDGGKGDNAYVYVTMQKTLPDEGEADLVTIGPCCNIDYKQGPEKFIEPMPDNIENKQLVIWYVAQLKNDNTKGKEYCWAEAVLKNGMYSTLMYPCFCGPMFIPTQQNKN
jgi:hypothetical protein